MVDRGSGSSILGPQGEYYAVPVARPSLRLAKFVEETWLHTDGWHHARARHRGRHGGLQRRQHTSTSLRAIRTTLRSRRPEYGRGYCRTGLARSGTPGFELSPSADGGGRRHIFRYADTAASPS